MKFLLFGSLLLAASVSSRSKNVTIYDHRPSYYNTTFVKVILTSDVRVREAIYSTPAVLLIGKGNGEILRCLQEDPNECELFYKAANNKVYALVVAGEYFYATLESGAILKCSLYDKSCKTHYKSDSPIVALAAGGGHLHFGFPSNIIWRCQLNQANCQSLHQERSPAFSFVQFDKYIYAGLNNGQLVRCSLASQNSCTVMYNMTGTVFGLTSMGKSIFAVTADGLLWNCTLTEDAIDTCVSKAIQLKNPRDIAAFDSLLFVLDVEGIKICNWSDEICSMYAPREESRSLAFAYSTYKMQGRYRNEDTTCTWQSDSKCPPYVTYYDEQQRAMLEVHVKQGKLYNSKGFLVNTSNADQGSSGPAAIFAMGPDGKILLSNLHKTGLIHTSSLFAGNPVAGVGEMVVKHGIIKHMNACSEHYQPDLTLNHQVVQSLLMQGYTEYVESHKCCQGAECDQISSNLLQ